MFTSKIRKKFHVSTERVYFAGRKGRMRSFMIGMRPYRKRAVYRNPKNWGALLAL